MNLTELNQEQLNLLAHNQRVIAEYLQTQRDQAQANLVLINLEIEKRKEAKPESKDK